MTTRVVLVPVVLVALAIVSGCVNGVILGGGTDPTVQAVATKANSVASSVGGQDGYGGTMMAGYRDHAPVQMGFRDMNDLASSTGTMMMRFHNEVEDDCTFVMSYVASHMGIDEQMMDVDVAAGETVTVEIPCGEMVGMGSLEEPGSRACLLSDGEEVDNLMAVPGFLGLDYECGGMYEHFLMHDVDDLDGDGDLAEHIVMSEAMDMHRRNGGPGGHAHGDGLGMMGSHMGM